MKIIPTRKQFSSWSIPSKVTYISFWVGIISLLIAILDAFVGVSNLSRLINIQDKIELSDELCKILMENPSIENIEQFKALFPDKQCDVNMESVEFVNGRDFFAVSAKLLAKHNSLTETILTNSSFSKYSKYYLLTLIDNTNEIDIFKIKDLIEGKEIYENINQLIENSFDEIENLYDKCSLKKHIMPSYQLYSDLIFEKIANINLETTNDSLIKEFNIPEYNFESRLILKNLILSSESMTQSKKQYWFNLSEIMNEIHLVELYCILLREREKLDDISAKYTGIGVSSINRSRRNSLEIAKDLVNERMYNESFSQLQKSPLIELKNDFESTIYILEKTLNENLIPKKYKAISESFKVDEYLDVQNIYGKWLLKIGARDGYRILQKCSSTALKIQDYYSFIRCNKTISLNLNEHLSYKTLEHVIKEVPKEYWANNRLSKSNILGSMGWYKILSNKSSKAINILKESLNSADQLWVYMNLAHAYYLTGNKDKAIKIYKEKYGEKVGELLWEDIIEKDYQIFLKKSLINYRDVEFIKGILKKAKAEKEIKNIYEELKNSDINKKT